MASDRSANEDNKVTVSKIEIRLNDFSTDLRELPTAIVKPLTFLITFAGSNRK
jgi:hypothetical protein